MHHPVSTLKVTVSLVGNQTRTLKIQRHVSRAVGAGKPLAPTLPGAEEGFPEEAPRSQVLVGAAGRAWQREELAHRPGGGKDQEETGPGDGQRW